MVSRMGEDYGEVRTVNGKWIVEEFGASHAWRKMCAANSFGIHFERQIPENEVESLGIDKLDPMVEKFRYTGTR